MALDDLVRLLDERASAEEPGWEVRVNSVTVRVVAATRESVEDVAQAQQAARDLADMVSAALHADGWIGPSQIGIIGDEDSLDGRHYATAWRGSLDVIASRNDH